MGGVSTRIALEKLAWTKGTVHLSIKVGAMAIEGKLILANTEDDCILELDLIS